MNFNHKILFIFVILLIYFGITGNLSIYDDEHKLLNGKPSPVQSIVTILYLLLLSSVIYYLILSQTNNDNIILSYSILLGLLVGFTEYFDDIMYKSEDTKQNAFLRILNNCAAVVISTELVHLYL